MATARAVTDSAGRQLTLCSDLKTETIKQRRINPWFKHVTGYEETTLGSLLSSDRFHLLGRYLIDRKKYLATTKCQAAKSGVVRSVLINNTEYRSNAYRIFHRSC